VLNYYVAHDGADVAQLAGSVFQAEDYGLAFVQGSPLRQAVDESLLAMRQDGVYDQIRSKYFGDD
jgi:polar amino acid transport system substrate-binding protein